MKRFLTQREADRCENAKEPVCKCRCGGAKHGAGRVPDGDFSSLPMDDPHYRPIMTRAEIIRFLKDAAVRFAYPRVVERNEYIRKFGWELWLIQDRLEQTAYHDAIEILGNAVKEVKQS